MSLLLDALKKAAEKKAQKSSQNADKPDAVESTDATQLSSESDATVVDQTVEDKTVSVTETEVDHSSYTETQLDTTELESTQVDYTEMDDTALQNTQLDATEVDHTRVDATELESTEIDHTQVDSTELESTELDHTQVDDTVHESTRLDATETDYDADDQTEIDQTSLDTTDIEIDETESTEIDSLQFISDADETQVDTTMQDSAELDTTEMDSTESEADSDQTEIGFQAQQDEFSSVIESSSQQGTDMDAMHASDDQTELDITNIDHTDLDITDIDATSMDDAVLDTIDMDDNPYSEAIDDDITAHNPMLDQEIGDDDITRTNEEITDLTEEDSTLLFFDESDDEFPELDEDALDQTSTETNPQAALEMDTQKDPALTIDDVTDFMGDGLRPEDETRVRESALSSDDTTITNSDSLSLTSIEIDSDGYDEEGRTTTESLNDGYQRVPPVSEDTISQSPELAVDDADRSTVLGMSSTISSIDIEKLTNDETVTIKSSSSTKTFAPDNYDRTLLNLSEKDVSRIFPGMRPDAGAVMTPDYAKKVFQSKSSSVKTHYIKVYVGIAFLLMLAVALWGMFEVQDEMNSIDNSLARLKRDPMPGMIKPQKTQTNQGLFADPVKVDDQTRQVIAEGDVTDRTPADTQLAAVVENEQASTEGSTDDRAENAADRESSEQMQGDAGLMADVKANTQQESGSGDDTAGQEAGSSPIAMVARDNPSTRMESVSSAQSANQSRLQISSDSKRDELAETLNNAYQAYEQSNLQKARALYDQAMSLDSGNRDALLGRAAIHVQDNELDQAIELYQQLLLANPKDTMAMTSLISVANIEPRAGESQIKRLLRESPEASYLHFALGNTFGSQGRWREAQGAYFDALRFNPNNPNYAYNLAVSLEHMGQANAASSYYRQALNNRQNGLAIFDADLVQQRIEVLTQ